MNNERFISVEEIMESYKTESYICSKSIATTLFLAYNLGKPILVEGPVGVGKTELAKTTAKYLGSDLIRLQCYEGLDESKALYEWKYGKQLLYTQILKDSLDKIINDAGNLTEAMDRLHQHEDVFFSPNFLEPRPLLKALQMENRSVLLIDEVDKADEEFEAFLLEILSDFQVSIPEIGTIGAKSRPFVFLTSNNTREISDALRRRCLHLYIPFPEAELESDIIQVKVPEITESLKTQLVSFIQQVRKLEIKKAPSIGETIDWAKVLLLLHIDKLNPEIVRETLSVILKFQEDVATLESKLEDITLKAVKETEV
ncbi:AAA family ATPase [Serpentinicella alkaliphila]|uniref:MoxR-like ATPase n=1 Tax=Serpentinicella alkaliphila TaxID=1734049 RepID=A0A4R2T2L1_9FIRM|nr:MoxR family ATPase [Serpentinicella alkaliphila]QUH26548.1 MoxR family ATPase [Serpentinicella alkaliphila]TCP96450.1 MoxR-like ATPase [Serpentinicella alkaliphila]